MLGFARRGTAIVLLPIWLCACITWQPQPVEPQQYIAEGRTGKVRLIMADSTVMTMRDPRLIRDSVVGDQDVGNTNRRVAVPLGEVTQVQTSHLSIGRTALAGAAIVGGVIVLILLSDAASNRVVY